MLKGEGDRVIHRTRITRTALRLAGKDLPMWRADCSCGWWVRFTQRADVQGAADHHRGVDR